MTDDRPKGTPQPLAWRVLSRKNVVAGLMFIAVGAFGLWESRNYAMGTALRMSTGYVPRLLCWVLLGLGALVLTQGLTQGRRSACKDGPSGWLHSWRAIVFVPLSLVVFAFALERTGVVIATLLLVGVGSLAGREFRPIETGVIAVVLTTVTLAIFVWGLNLPIPVWPGG